MLHRFFEQFDFFEIANALETNFYKLCASGAVLAVAEWNSSSSKFTSSVCKRAQWKESLKLIILFIHLTIEDVSARLIMSGLETQERKVRISRKTIYVIVVVLVLVASAVVMTHLLSPSSTTAVKIVRFFLVDEPDHLTIGVHMEGDEMIFPFYVKVENQGSNNVSNLVVVVKVLGDHSELGSDTASIETLQAGRRRTMSMVVRVNVSELQGKFINYIATLYLDNTIVDEAIGEV